MSRPPKWNSETISIRVPKHTVDHLLEQARLLDSPKPESFVQIDSRLVAINEERYLIGGVTCSPSEYDRAGEIVNETIAQLVEAGMKRRDAAWFLLAGAAEKWGRRV